MQVGRLRIAPVHARQLKIKNSMAHIIYGTRNVSDYPIQSGRDIANRREPIPESEQDDSKPRISHLTPPSSFFLKQYMDKKQEYLSRASLPPPALPTAASNFVPRPEVRSIWDEDRLETLPQHPTEFYEILDAILRRSAPTLRLKLYPDGFFRVSDILECHRLFKSFNASTLIDMCKDDPLGRFELAQLPDIVDGKSQETIWIRSTGYNMINGVDPTTQRVLSMSRLKTLLYLAPEYESNEIEKNGIRQGRNRYIRLYRSVETSSFNDSQIRAKNHSSLCVAIDSELAAQLGVMFFVDTRNFVMAVGNKDGVIPRAACLSGSLLRVKTLPLLNLKKR